MLFAEENEETFHISAFPDDSIPKVRHMDDNFDQNNSLSIPQSMLENTMNASKQINP